MKSEIIKSVIKIQLVYLVPIFLVALGAIGSDNSGKNFKTQKQHWNNWSDNSPLFSPFLLTNSFTKSNIDFADDTVINSELESIRDMIRTDFIKSEFDDDEVNDLLNSIHPAGTWPDIDYVDVSRNAFEHSRHLNNMVVLSRAYRNPDSQYYSNQKLKQAIKSAFDYWLEHDFICENWWWNQMGTPRRMVEILLLMDDDLTETQKQLAGPIVGRANFEASGARPGGDLIQIAGIYGKYGLFIRDVEKVHKAIDKMSGEIIFAVDRGDPTDLRGLQKDFSFHHRHHRVIYNLTYGRGYTRSFANWASKVAGTNFSFPDEAIELLVDFFLDGIVLSSAWGKYPDPGALSRELGRTTILDPFSPTIPEQLLQVTSYRQKELEKIAGIRRCERELDLTSNHFFWHSEYFSHQRPDYFTSVRMYSSRNNNVDGPHNSEGLKNHHLADGSNFLIRTGEEYYQIFPVWDWQKIPGTTVVQKQTLPERDKISVQGITDFVGGISNGLYGAAVIDFESPVDTLGARKSWFFFDDEFVALGAGIHSSSVFPVVTTVNQNLLKGDVTIQANGDTFHPEMGEHDLQGVSWIHHDQTAYLFSVSVDVSLENQQRSGTWEKINDSASVWGLDEEHKDVFTLWLNHGVAPEQGEYEYIVVPGIEESKVEGYHENLPLEIIANTPQIQAVQQKELGITQIIFYEKKDIEITEGISISSDRPGMMMVKKTDGLLEEITISDPSRKLDSFQFTVTARIEIENDQWSAVWDEDKGKSSISVMLPEGDYAGQSISYYLSR